MELEVEHTSGIAVIKVTEVMVGDDTDELVTTVKQLLNDGIRQFIIDLSESGRLDSSGIGNLVVAYIEVTKQSGWLVTVMPSFFFESPLFGTSMLPSIIELFRSREEAMKAMLDPDGSPESTESGSSGCSTSAFVVLLLGTMILLTTRLS